MVRSAKQCLKKTVGKNCQTHSELLTLVVEVEAVLNSMPLTYVSSEDVEKPLTPNTSVSRRSVQKAATHTQDRILGCTMED